MSAEKTIQSIIKAMRHSKNRDESMLIDLGTLLMKPGGVAVLMRELRVTPDNISKIGSIITSRLCLDPKYFECIIEQLYSVEHGGILLKEIVRIRPKLSQHLIIDDLCQSLDFERISLFMDGEPCLPLVEALHKDFGRLYLKYQDDIICSASKTIIWVSRFVSDQELLQSLINIVKISRSLQVEKYCMLIAQLNQHVLSRLFIQLYKQKTILKRNIESIEDEEQIDLYSRIILGIIEIIQTNLGQKIMDSNDILEFVKFVILEDDVELVEIGLELLDALPLIQNSEITRDLQIILDLFETRFEGVENSGIKALAYRCLLKLKGGELNDAIQETKDLEPAIRAHGIGWITKYINRASKQDTSLIEHDCINSSDMSGLFDILIELLGDLDTFVYLHVIKALFAFSVHPKVLMKLLEIFERHSMIELRLRVGEVLLKVLQTHFHERIFQTLLLTFRDTNLQIKASSCLIASLITKNHPLKFLPMINQFVDYIIGVLKYESGDMLRAVLVMLSDFVAGGWKGCRLNEIIFLLDQISIGRDLIASGHARIIQEQLY